MTKIEEKTEVNTTKYLKENEKYIPYKLIEDSISFTDLKKQTVEERSTNLFYETLSGKGKTRVACFLSCHQHFFAQNNNYNI